MNTKTNVLAAGIVAAIGCSVANAQFSYTNALSLNGATIIYSNAFNGEAVSIDGTAPTVANSVIGGSSAATWNVVSNNPATGAYLYQNGSVGLSGNSYLLPFTPKTNYVYVLTVSANLPAMAAGKWTCWGFAQYASNKSTSSRFSDTTVNGYDFTIGTCVAGSEQYWAGPRASGYGISAQLMPTAGNHVLQIILDTTGTTTTNWIGASFVDGKQLGTNWTYASNPLIGAAGLGQTTLSSSDGIQYVYFTLSGTPLVIGRQPVSATVSASMAFTNSVAVAGSGPLSYQWYNNGAVIAGATNASLVFNPVAASNNGTNYYVVVTNNFGSVTSTVASLTVYTNPVITAAYPVPYTSPISLFGGADVNGTAYPGSSPTFSVSALGGVPLTYQWLTNGVAVGGATGASFTFTNCQLNSPTQFACIVANSYGSATNAWTVSYVAAPQAPFPSAVLGTQPIGYWRLNEEEVDYNGDDGVLALDYGSGNNGIYTNVYLGNPGYSASTDPNETSVQFSGSGSSDAFGIQGIDFAAPTNTSVTFSVEAWVNNGIAVEPANAGIVAKGYGGAEEFALYVNGGYQFLVRDAAGNLHTATSSIGPVNNTWQYVVGVCDEANSNLTIYVNGVQAGTATIAPKSGVLASGASVPMTIGARSSSASVGYNDLQYRGFMNDVAIHNHALSAAMVAALYSKTGNAIPISFIPPLPPTNVVYQADGTLTIPATILGEPPIGYYWTNLTTGDVLGSGATSAFENLNATLTIPNPASLSGDQLELVVTNATSFTNAVVTLFSPAPPVTLDYANPILYSNYFNGGTWSIAKMPVTAANALVGGASTTWVDALGTNDTGSMQASGLDACTFGNSWLLPFTPRAGYVYTLAGSLTFYGNPGNWVGLGFAQNVPTNTSTTTGRFSDGGTGPNGYDWMLLNESSGNVQYFAGPGGSVTITNQNGLFTAGAGTHAVQVVLDTTGAHWVISAAVDGVSAGTNTYANNPSISGVGITQNALSTPADVQWNYLALSQVAPGGVPPYLFAPLPPANVTLLADTSLSIPVTAFGSTPFGYYWSNSITAAVLGAGATDTLAPLNATLSIADVPYSWNGGTLSLVVTNAYGTNVSLVTLTVTNAINPNPGPIQYSVTGNSLTLSWPTNAGWELQAQTNSLTVGIGTNWVNVAASTSTNQIIVPINPTNGGVFYRLLRPF